MDDSAQEFNKREVSKKHKEEERQKARTASVIKNLSILLVIVGVVVGIGYGLVKLSDPNTSFAPELSGEVGSSDHIKGNVDAPVTLVEYGDYQCPGCAAYYPLIIQAEENFKDTLRVVFRHFPLPGHANALPAAYAAEAASMQGKFWEMSELLYAFQNDWSELGDTQSKFDEYAQSLELDMEKFHQDMSSDEVKNKVEDDLQSGIDSKINATPTFYINGSKVEKLPASPQAFFDLIQKEIDQNK